MIVWIIRIFKHERKITDMLFNIEKFRTEQVNQSVVRAVIIILNLVDEKALSMKVSFDILIRVNYCLKSTCLFCLINCLKTVWCIFWLLGIYFTLQSVVRRNIGILDIIILNLFFMILILRAIIQLILIRAINVQSIRLNCVHLIIFQIPIDKICNIFLFGCLADLIFAVLNIFLIVICHLL